MDSNQLLKVKLVAAVLHQTEGALAEAYQWLEKTFSRIDIKGNYFPFQVSDYYEPEMGANLKRGIISFEELIHPGKLAENKLKTRELEQRLAEDGNRQVNIDIGYLDMYKVVLASFKGRSNKIYMSEGIWADIVLVFEKGDFTTLNWGFPDFKSGIYNETLLSIRNRYKEQVKETGKMRYT